MTAPRPYTAPPSGANSRPFGGCGVARLQRGRKRAADTSVETAAQVRSGSNLAGIDDPDVLTSIDVGARPSQHSPMGSCRRWPAPPSLIPTAGVFLLGLRNPPSVKLPALASGNLGGASVGIALLCEAGAQHPHRRSNGEYLELSRKRVFGWVNTEWCK